MAWVHKLDLVPHSVLYVLRGRTAANEKFVVLEMHVLELDVLSWQRADEDQAREASSSTTTPKARSSSHAVPTNMKVNMFITVQTSAVLASTMVRIIFRADNKASGIYGD